MTAATHRPSLTDNAVIPPAANDPASSSWMRLTAKAITLAATDRVPFWRDRRRREVRG